MKTVSSENVLRLKTTVTEPITVICVRFGKAYSRDYVEKLRNMVSRHLTVPYEFVCLTDDPTPITGVRLIYQLCQSYKKLWWHKIHLFDKTLPISGKILYFDLDIVINDNIDKLVLLDTNKLLGIRDFNRKFHPSIKYFNSSVMCWPHGQHNYIYDNFKTSQYEALKLPGDQDWIWKVAVQDIEFFPDIWIQSYKWEIRSREELADRNGSKGFKVVSNKIPEPGCCVAVFHGNPKPEMIADNFVVTNWR